MSAYSGRDALHLLLSWLTIVKAITQQYIFSVIRFFGFTASNQTKAGESAAIEAIVEGLRKHIDDPDACEDGCITLYNMSEANGPIQKSICEKGGLKILLEILERYNRNQNVTKECIGTIGVVVSSTETHKAHFDSFMKAVSDCCDINWGSKEITLTYYGIIRENYNKVKEAVFRNKCTNDAFPKCKKDCGSDRNLYCPLCCIQQKAYRCYTCDRVEVKLYCETCWKKHHQGHEGDEFFYPVRCATKTK